MKSITKTIDNFMLDETIRDYSGLGYDVLGTEKKGTTTVVHFGRPVHLPQMQRIKALERKFNFLKYKQHYHGFFFILLAAAVLVLFTMLPIIPTNIGNFFAKTLKMGDIGLMIGKFSAYILAGFFMIFAILEIFWMIARKSRYQYEKNEIVTEGLEIQLKIRILPKDEFVRKDGTHYHKIYDWFVNRER